MRWEASDSMSDNKKKNPSGAGMFSATSAGGDNAIYKATSTGGNGMMYAYGSPSTGGTAKPGGSPIKYTTSYQPWEYEKLPEYQVSEFEQSAETDRYNKALQDLEGNAPGPYESKYGNYIDDTINKILNRESFNYDFNADSLYQQYKDSYTKLGNEAAANAASNAAALSGGYGSSYATQAAAQANQQYLTELNNKIPELASLALDKYKMETQDMYNQYNMLSDAERDVYNQYVDNRNFYNADRDYYQNAYSNSRDYDLNRWSATEQARLNAAKYNQDESHYAADYGQSERQFGYNYALNSAQFEEAKRQWAAEFALRSAKSGGRVSGSPDIDTYRGNAAADSGKYGVTDNGDGTYTQVGTDAKGNRIIITYDKNGNIINQESKEILKTDR